jgi:hypothetical protein
MGATLIRIWTPENLKIALCLVMIFAETAVIMQPLVRYVRVGWDAKRHDIMDSFSAEAILAYYQMFSQTSQSMLASSTTSMPPNDASAQTPATSPPMTTANVSGGSLTPAQSKEITGQFEALYTKQYGRNLLIIPGALLLLVTLVGSTLTTLSVLKLSAISIGDGSFIIPTPAVAALAGAYLWVVNDFISRARRLDFAPSDVMWGILRLVIAIPMGYAFASAASAVPADFIAFALGAFPLSTLTSMLRQIADRLLTVQAEQDEPKDSIVKLQGVNKAILERLANEDVTTITQIAYCDPVRLVMRSNLTFNFVTDCMNQALARMYLEDVMEKIRPLGMRGACEIKNLIDDLDGIRSDDEGKRDLARAVMAFPVIASTAGIDADALQITFRQIAEDPFTVYLEQVWG